MAWDGRGEDPWLPERIAGEVDLQKAERKLYHEWLGAAASWLTTVRRAVLAPFRRDRSRGRPDPTAVHAFGQDWTDRMNEVVDGPVRQIMEAGYEQILGDGYEWDTRPAATEHLAAVRNRMVRTPDEVFSMVAAELARAANLGETPAEMAARVDEVLTTTDTERWQARASTVARTETAAALGASRHDSYVAQAEELGGEWEHGWLATCCDGRTRPDHWAADGQRVPLGEPFVVGGEPLLYPGWPFGSASNVINCRCGEVFLRPGEEWDLTGRQFLDDGRATTAANGFHLLGEHDQDSHADLVDRMVEDAEAYDRDDPDATEASPNGLIDWLVDEDDGFLVGFYPTGDIAVRIGDVDVGAEDLSDEGFDLGSDEASVFARALGDLADLAADDDDEAAVTAAGRKGPDRWPAGTPGGLGGQWKPDADIPLGDLTVPVLRALAKDRGIKLPTKADLGRVPKKADIIAALTVETDETTQTDRVGVTRPGPATTRRPGSSVADFVGHYQQRQASLRIDRGDPTVKPLPGGISSAVDLLTYPDGTRRVRKDYGPRRPGSPSGTEPHRFDRLPADREEAAALVLDAVGVPTAAVARTDDDASILMEYVDGRQGGESGVLKAPLAVRTSDAGRLLGLADAIMGHRDRNGGGWMQVTDGIVTIDNGNAFGAEDQSAFGNPFVSYLMTRGGWKRDLDLDREQLDAIRGRLEALRPEFVRLGMPNQHKQMMDRLAGIRRNTKVKGAQIRLEAPPGPAPRDRVVETDEADLTLQAGLDARARRTAARTAIAERRQQVARGTGTARLLAELDELIAKKADDATIRARLDPALIGPEQLFADADPAVLPVLERALATGDRAKLRAAMTRQAKKFAITPVGKAGQKVAYDPELHETLGNDLDPGISAAEVENRVRAAYLELTEEPGRLVSLARLRNLLADLSRPEQDTALRRMSRAGDLLLSPDPNRKALPREAREAALRVGGEDVHLLSIVDPSVRPPVAVQPGDQVEVVRRGSTLTLPDGEVVPLERARVVGVAKPVPRAPRRPRAPTPEEQGRQRQEEIDRITNVASAAATIDEWVDNADDQIGTERDRDSMRRKLANLAERYPLPDDVRSRMLAAVEAGDAAALVREADAYAQAEGLAPIGRAGDVVTFDRELHTATDGAGAEWDGRRVQVVRQGYRRTEDGQLLARPVVELLDADEVGPAVRRAAERDARRRQAAETAVVTMPTLEPVDETRAGGTEAPRYTIEKDRSGWRVVQHMTEGPSINVGAGGRPYKTKAAAQARLEEIGRQHAEVARAETRLAEALATALRERNLVEVPHQILQPGDLYTIHPRSYEPLLKVTAVEHFPNGASLVRHERTGPADEGYLLHLAGSREPIYRQATPVPARDYAARVTAVAQLVATSPPEDSRQLGGGQTADTSLLTYSSGRLVRKVYGRRVPGGKAETRRQIDGETLAPLVLEALGIGGPATHRVSDNEIVQEYIDGQIGLEIVPWGIDMPDAIADSDDGRLLGLADVLTNNGDRNNGNWLRLPDGRLVGIDHGETFEARGVSTSAFAEHFTMHDTNDVSPEDLALIRDRLTTLEPAFAALKRGTWHRQMMGRLDEVAKQATGTRNRLTREGRAPAGGPEIASAERRPRTSASPQITPDVVWPSFALAGGQP